MCKGNNLYICCLKDLKYLFAYTVPLSAYLSFSSTGFWTYSAVIYAFVIIPALDVLFGTSDENLEEGEENKKNVVINVATVLKSIAVGILREGNVDFIILKMVCVLIVEVI